MQLKTITTCDENNPHTELFLHEDDLNDALKEHYEAEYVMKRKLVLDVFEESLKFKPDTDQESEYEDVLHDIICPLKSTSSDLDYDDHNLWIVDDRLAFYSYFNSDTRMERQVSAGFTRIEGGLPALDDITVKLRFAPGPSQGWQQTLSETIGTPRAR